MFRLAITVLPLVMLGCGVKPPSGGTEPSDEFELSVTPLDVADTIPGQRCVLLVTAEEAEEEDSGKPITVTASGDGMNVSMAKATILPGEMTEVMAQVMARDTDAEPPVEGQQGWNCMVTVKAIRGSVEHQVQIPITVTSEEKNTVWPTARQIRNQFVPWLAENRPELGIDEDTEWVGTVLRPHWLVVTHYLYFSDEWEMHVFWHIMIPPYDWARIELRRRMEESLPSVAFEITSRSAETLEFREIEPEGELWR